jgi:hypothetical protein
MKHEKLLIGAYVVCSILTFGHSFNHQENTYVDWGGVEKVNSRDEMVFNAFFTGLVFPFYWSIKLFEVDK